MDTTGLVTLASNTLVAAAVTDAWEAARRGFARLFGRGHPDPVAGRRLDDARQRLAAAAPSDLDRVRADLASQWAIRLADLLEEHPDAGEELRALVDEVRKQLPAGVVSAASHSVAAGRDVTVTADRGSIAAGVIHGNVAPPGPTSPGTASV